MGLPKEYKAQTEFKRVRDRAFIESRRIQAELNLHYELEQIRIISTMLIKLWKTNFTMSMLIKMIFQSEKILIPS